MAEAFVNALYGDKFTAESAGLEPGALNLFVVEVMKETGIDISQNRCKSVVEMIDAGKRFNYVITVCDSEAAERCPIFPGGGRRIHWNFADPSKLSGDKEAVLQQVRIIRDQIKVHIYDFINAALRLNAVSL
jgi:arsenate reductase